MTDVTITNDAWMAKQREIDALRADNERLQGLLDHSVEVMNDGTLGAALLLDENRQLKAEITRLREALRDAQRIIRHAL